LPSFKGPEWRVFTFSQHIPHPDQQALATLQIDQMIAAVDLIEALGSGWNRS